LSTIYIWLARMYHVTCLGCGEFTLSVDLL
jgi:hypothetical protein